MFNFVYKLSQTKGKKIAMEMEAIPMNEQHATIVEERNNLLQQLKKVQNELSLARRIIEQQVIYANFWCHYFLRHSILTTNCAHLMKSLFSYSLVHLASVVSI